MAPPNTSKVNQAFINNLNQAVTHTYGEVTQEHILRFSLAYCLNQRIHGDSIETTIAPFQRIFPVYPIHDWSVAVMYIAYAIWALCKTTST